MPLAKLTEKPLLKAKILAAGCGAVDGAQLDALCDALADWVVDLLTSRASVIVGPAAAGLQTTTALGAPTGPPAAPVVLTIT